MATAFAWPRVRPIVKVYRHLKEAPVRTETESDPVSGHGCCGDGRSLPGVGLLGGWPNRDTVSRPLHARHWPCMPDSRAVTRVLRSISSGIEGSPDGKEADCSAVPPECDPARPWGQLVTIRTHGPRAERTPGTRHLSKSSWRPR